MKLRLVVLLNSMLVLHCADPLLAANLTIHNNTPTPVWVCIANRWGGGEVLAIDASSAHAEPYRIRVNGWYKIEPYGGSANVPFGRYMLVLGPKAKRHVTAVKNDEGFPIKKGWKPVSIDATFTSDPYANTWAGLNAYIQKDKSLEVRLFVPIDFFKSSDNSIRITKEKLGW